MPRFRGLSGPRFAQPHRFLACRRAGTSRADNRAKLPITDFFFTSRYRLFYCFSRMSNLKSTIEELANDFAMSIIHALRAASIDELTGMGAREVRAGRPAAAAPAADVVGRK